MNYCRDYYDADAVAQESRDALYREGEAETFCDCGSVAMHGDVYCQSCKETIGAVMREAIDQIMRLNGFDWNAAEAAMVDWLENPEKSEEE